MNTRELEQKEFELRFKLVERINASAAEMWADLGDHNWRIDLPGLRTFIHFRAGKLFLQYYEEEREVNGELPSDVLLGIYASIPREHERYRSALAANVAKLAEVLND